MDKNECKKDLIQYVIKYEQGKVNLTPCIEVFQHIFKERYSNLEIEKCTRELVSSGKITLYSFHSYLKMYYREFKKTQI